MKLNFCSIFTLGIYVFCKVMIKNSRSIRINKFAISLQYLKEKLGMKFIFCMQINIKNFSQVDIIIPVGSSQTCPKHPKQEVGIFLQQERNFATALCSILIVFSLLLYPCFIILCSSCYQKLHLIILQYLIRLWGLSKLYKSRYEIAISYKIVQEKTRKAQS